MGSLNNSCNVLNTFFQFERQKMEREHKKKQEALTLEETKQQIQNFETKLTQLKEEKHQLFNTLKKVCLFECKL